MKTWLAVALGAVVGGLVVAGLVFSLAPQETAQRADATASGLTSADCVRVVPDSVFDTLGWGGDAATEHAGRCEKSGDDGYVTVGDLAVVSKSDGRRAAAQQEYDERCSTLFGEVSATPELDIDWLPDGTTACARLLPAGTDVGLAELFLLTGSDEVVQIRLAALTPTSGDAVRAGLAALVTTAESQW